ncbi:MAG TPA: PDZ domain-containing protein [Labilithrix sp.]|nr:PDZ domain-containing protein [Labilithrix sp.]
MVDREPTPPPGRIGLTIGVKAGRLVVTHAPDGSAGRRAGIHSGDHIVRIDQDDTANMDRSAAAARLRGPAGTPVILWIARAGTTDLLRVEVVRDKADLPSLAGVGKFFLGFAGVLGVVGAIVAVTWSSTSPHKDGATSYASLLRKNRPQDAYALLASERRQTLSYDAWLGTMNTPLLARASELSVSSTTSNSAGRGCVRASVEVEGNSVGLTFFTLAEGAEIRIHSVMTNDEQSGMVTRAPWSCN